MRSTNVQFRTTVATGLLPPLRHHEVAPKVNRTVVDSVLCFVKSLNNFIF